MESLTVGNLYIDLRRPEKDNFWYRGLLCPIYKESQHRNWEINVLTDTHENAAKVIESKQSVSHYLDSIWLQGSQREFYDAFSKAVQEEVNREANQA